MAEPLSDVWTQSSGSLGNPNTPTVTFPAIPGIAWELLAATLDVGAVGAVAGTYTLVINGVSYAFAYLTATASTNAQASWSGSLVFPPNTAVTVTSGAVIASGDEGIVTAQARPR